MEEIKQGIQTIINIGIATCAISIISFIIFIVCTICNSINIRKIAVNSEKLANKKRKRPEDLSKAQRD